ncbi:DUF6913 domain-containing protein [Dysgonomonas mossii]|uniref:DUF6913 domain-containing protein n=1 Tax=Dysgonomonas mossii TaxID=163665 RepID=UPI0039939B5E
MFDFLVKWKINSAFRDNKRKHAFRNLESMKSVLILFSYSDWPTVAAISKDLAANGKKVILWTYQSTKKATGNTIFPANVRIIQPQEVSFFQILNSSVLDEFKALEYDTLIDLTTTESKVYEYLLANNSSEFSIGIIKPDRPFYDFLVLKTDEMNLQETYQQIKNYLSKVL